MDTYEQFRDSERRTFPIRVAVVATALLLGLALPATRAHLIWWGVVALFGVAVLGVVKVVEFKSGGRLGRGRVG